MNTAIVVGGGIIGASTAYSLARGGVETLLIDREDDGRATAAGAGIISPPTSSRTADDTWFTFAIEAVEYYSELIDRLESAGYETGYASRGLLAVAADDDEIASFEEAIERIDDRQERLGVPAPGSIEQLSTASARDRFPPLAETHRAFFYDGGARVDGRLLTRALRRAGTDLGLETVSASAEHIDPDPEVEVETADGERYQADAVVIAGGAWSATFGDQLGIEIPVEPERGQIIHLDCEYETADWPVVKGFRGHYIVPWADGRVAFGATRESDAGFDSEPTAGGIHEVLEEGLRIAPGLADAHLKEIRVGLRPTSADRLPILGMPAEIENVYLATGHGATGLQLGPYSGKCIADLVQGNEPEAEILPFSPDRF
ncbi:FAD-dependent oxidoreductase [Natronococcus pandeyae]|uniref:FAD-dependent oxidoreductase n=1 Tax=Natronococcus pandeyae TaxID=2055836 RepID=A0A8J8PYZ1_9EURY|nr:FAD-dependent oxidoreductase [Natronococcus pandeyae]TYL36376.1 FAD-dependent oxidoreductase [Natronococcus pandeyae]